MGTITGISDLDPVRWKNSQWRNLQVEIVAFSVFLIMPNLLIKNVDNDYCHSMFFHRLVGMSQLLEKGVIESQSGRLNQ